MADLTPAPPQRPFLWPTLVENLAALLPNPERVYLVGGVVRDALLRRPIHDIDLATPDDGLEVARGLADSLGGAYYPVDPERRTGRVVLGSEGITTDIDVASFRGAEGATDNLLADLAGRDFTVNALAVRLDDIESIIDPLEGQRDLFQRRALRLCSPTSIADDPIRVLRALRHSLKFKLRLIPQTVAALRASASSLLTAHGDLRQPERSRDELFKLLQETRPASALRLAHTLSLLHLILPFELAESDLAFRHVERLDDLLRTISYRRDDNVAADLMLGVAVMVLDRHRQPLNDHFAQQSGVGRYRQSLAYLAVLAEQSHASAETWADWLFLSNQERHVLASLDRSRDIDLFQVDQVDDRWLYRCYKRAGDGAIDHTLISLASYLASSAQPSPDRWGKLLDQIASPIFAAYFDRYDQIVTPQPLLDGHALMADFGLEPGPILGEVIDRLKEEQAAGAISTDREARAWVADWLDHH
ncbi:MAG: CCA tRNA nucleotidyltransferase [Chloroflexi bacterium]|nr:CCA tRNA nucleotidyltransferase [Chloroflexota bacterium]